MGQQICLNKYEIYVVMDISFSYVKHIFHYFTSFTIIIIFFTYLTGINVISTRFTNIFNNVSCIISTACITIFVWSLCISVAFFGLIISILFVGNRRKDLTFYIFISDIIWQSDINWLPEMIMISGHEGFLFSFFLPYCKVKCKKQD